MIQLIIPSGYLQVQHDGSGSIYLWVIVVTLGDAWADTFRTTLFPHGPVKTDVKCKHCQSMFVLFEQHSLIDVLTNKTPHA